MNFIDGSWTSTETVEEDVKAALKAARRALPYWRKADRLPLILGVQKRLDAKKDELALAITTEVGKPLWEAKQEVTAMRAKIDISLEAYAERTGKKLEQMGDVSLLIDHKPHGVAAILAPYNFPGHLPFGHMIPALIAGNTLIYKPSPETPRVGQIVTRLFSDLPAGVVNCVQGGGDVGHWISSSDELDALFFTGSAQVGWKLVEEGARHPRRITAIECGGNNPLVVSSIKDIVAATYVTALSAYLTAGQRCTCARRLILVGEIADPFLPTLISMMGKLRVGPPLEDPFMGPLVSEAAAIKVEKAYERLIVQGAQPLVKLKRQGAFIHPTLVDVTGIQTDDVEIFGPLLQVKRVASIEEAIVEANNTQYGLAAGILTDNKAHADLFLQSARAGVVNWNTPLTGASSRAPFGGLGRSGNDRPSAYYAADYCAYPRASMQRDRVAFPQKLVPGIDL